MELHKAREIVSLPATVDNTNWVLWVDDEIWGYTSTLENAQWFLTKISNSIRSELEKEQPSWKIDTVTVDDKTVKVKCLHPGYVYNSRWTAHTIRYEAVFKLVREAARSRAPSVDKLKAEERNSKPPTRPPTPRPEEKMVSPIPPPPPQQPPKFVLPEEKTDWQEYAGGRKRKRNRKR